MKEKFVLQTIENYENSKITAEKIILELETEFSLEVYNIVKKYFLNKKIRGKVK